MELGLALILSGIAFGVGTAIAILAGDTDISPTGFYVAATGLFVLGVGVCAVPALGTLPRTRRADNDCVEPEPEPESGTPEDISLDNLNLSITASHEYIGKQVATAGGVDAQLIGLMVVLATAGGVFAIIQHALNADRGILLAGVVSAAIICLLGLVVSPELDPGPVPTDFFVKFAGDSPHEYAWRMLTELGKTIAKNDQAVVRRQGALNAALLILALTPVIWGVVRALS